MIDGDPARRFPLAQTSPCILRERPILVARQRLAKDDGPPRMDPDLVGGRLCRGTLCQALSQAPILLKGLHRVPVSSAPLSLCTVNGKQTSSSRNISMR